MHWRLLLWTQDSYVQPPTTHILLDISQISQEQHAPKGMLEFPSHKVTPSSTQLLKPDSVIIPEPSCLLFHSILSIPKYYYLFEYISVNACQVHPLFSIFTATIQSPSFLPGEASLESLFPCDLFHHILHKSVIRSYKNLNPMSCLCLEAVSNESLHLEKI